MPYNEVALAVRKVRPPSGGKDAVKLLFYSHSFAPRVGGVETSLMHLARGLAERAGPGGEAKLEVTVATPVPAEGFDDAALPFAVVRRSSLATLWRLVGKADVVHIAGPAFLPLLLALLRRKPVVVEHHGYQAACPNGLFLYEPSKTVCPGHFLARRYHLCLRCNRSSAGWPGSLRMLVLAFPRRWLCKRATRNVMVSDYVARRVALPRSQTIYYGIPRPVPGPQGSPVRSGPERPLCFAYVGRLVSEKGLGLLLQAAQKLDAQQYEFRLKFIGDGPERASLEARAATLGLEKRVAFAGWLTGAALEAELEEVAVVVMPSLCEETAGLAAIEQMMRGRLVIASEIGGLGEVVNGAGLKFPPGDASALTACMRQVLEAPARVNELGRKAQSRALQLFVWERMLEEHLTLYKGLAWPSLSTSRRGCA